MAIEDPTIAAALQKLPDGTVKQRNMLTGTEVWTVPGRGHRPLTVPTSQPHPLDKTKHRKYCAFCTDRYLETPPEKSRIVRESDGTWQQIDGVSARAIHDTIAEFRRIPNLYEIVSYNYWRLNHGHEPTTAQRQRLAEYLSQPEGYDHVLRVVRARLAAYGMGSEDIATISETDLLGEATGFFCGGHDVIVGRRHYVHGATMDDQLASAGTLSVEEHRQYIAYTARSIGDLYDLNPAVMYVAAFQNWLKPAGASFDHLHKQLVAIDEMPVQIQDELNRLRKNPQIYEQILRVCATRGLLVARNENAVAMAGIGHRYPTLAVWPLGPAVNPWEAEPEVVRDVSDLLHALHAATGSEVPCNEEWYHRPKSVTSNMRWRILLKWRISTLAGFEGGTRIYLNSIDPWGVHDRVLPKLHELRDSGAISDMQLGSEVRVDPVDLGANR